MQAFGQTTPVLQVIASAGGYVSTSTMSITWTLGEPVISTIKSADESIILTQGFHQGNLFGTGIVNPELTSLKFKMYPNPTINKVWFEINNKDAKGTFIVEVYDITGRKIISQELGQFENQQEKEFSVSSLKSGIYLVKVTIGNFNSDVIKLIKE